MHTAPVPLRVAYFFAYPDTLAGASRSLFDLILHLPSEIKPLVLVAAEGRVAAACRQEGIACHVIQAGSGLMTFGKRALRWSLAQRADVFLRELLPYTLRLARELRRLRIDLVHANDSRGALLAGPATALVRLPMVTHLRGRKAYSGAYWRAFEVLSTRIIAVCHALHRDISPAARNKVITVYNGVADLHSSRIPTGSSPRSLRWLEATRAGGAVTISCFASVTPFKGYHHLLEAVARLEPKTRSKALFLGVGAIPAASLEYEAWLLERMRQLGIDNFTFAGWQDDPLAFYQQTDIAVLPSVESETLVVGNQQIEVEGNEGFPRTHLEAMSVGLPVVGTDIGGVREQVIDGVTGFVVPPGDPMALAQSIEQLIWDTALRKRMGEAGRRHVLETFPTRRCVEETLGVYRSLVPRAQLPTPSPA